MPWRLSAFCNRIVAQCSLAGSIGFYLTEAIRTLELQQTSLIILMILVSVAPIDYVSDQWRFAVIGCRGVVA